MGRATFPTLLSKKATIIGSLTRYDLVTMGVVYILLSLTNLSGMWAIAINVLVLFLIKTAQKWLRPGFFKFLGRERRLEWSKAWEDLHE